MSIYDDDDDVLGQDEIVLDFGPGDDQIEVFRIGPNFPILHRFYAYTTEVETHGNRLYSRTKPYYAGELISKTTSRGIGHFVMTLTFKNVYNEHVIVQYGQINPRQILPIPYFNEVEQMTDLPSLQNLSRRIVHENFDLSPLDPNDLRSEIVTRRDSRSYQYGGKRKPKSRKRKTRSKRR